jgi:hypothetical protein
MRAVAGNPANRGGAIVGQLESYCAMTFRKISLCGVLEQFAYDHAQVSATMGIQSSRVAREGKLDSLWNGHPNTSEQFLQELGRVRFFWIARRD